MEQIELTIIAQRYLIKYLAKKLQDERDTLNSLIASYEASKEAENV